MDQNTLRKIIEDKIINLSGNSFQDFCDRLGLALYPDDYTPVRAGGSKGDMSNDGYCPKARIFFAAHATRGEDISKTKTKIKGDLEGCITKHSDVQRWIYLTNDTLVGEVETHVDDLRREHSSVTIETWSHKIIAGKILELSNTSIETVLDMVLNLSEQASNQGGDIQEWNIIDDIFVTVIARLKSINGYVDKVRINLEDKIKLNFENEDDRGTVRSYFFYALTKVSLIEQRIQEEDGDIQNDLHSHLLNQYYELKLAGHKNIHILHELFKIFIPAGKEADPTYSNLSKAFVLFFFDDCTIFEKTESEKKVQLP